jgi:hypothetical protein
MGFKLKNIYSIYMYYVIIKVLLILNIVFWLRSLNVRSFFFILPEVFNWKLTCKQYMYYNPLTSFSFQMNNWALEYSRVFEENYPQSSKFDCSKTFDILFYVSFPWTEKTCFQKKLPVSCSWNLKVILFRTFIDFYIFQTFKKVLVELTSLVFYMNNTSIPSKA